MEASSLSMASTRSSGCELQKFSLGIRQFSLVRRADCPWRWWFGIKDLQSQAGQMYLQTVTGVIDSPLVVSPGDHLKSLPTFFYNDLYETVFWNLYLDQS